MWYQLDIRHYFKKVDVVSSVLEEVDILGEAFDSEIEVDRIDATFLNFVLGGGIFLHSD